MIIVKKTSLSSLILFAIFWITAVSAQGPVEKGLIESAKPMVDRQTDGLYVFAPQIDNLVVMNVRVYNNESELVLNVRSFGEMVDLQAADLPDGKYRYETNTVFKLDGFIGGHEINGDEGISRDAGEFTISSGEMIELEEFRGEETAGRMDAFLNNVAAVLAWTMSGLVADASASEPATEFARVTISDREADLILDGGSLAHPEYVIRVTANDAATTGRFALYDTVGEGSGWDAVIVIDTVENSVIGKSFVVGSNGDLSWGNLGMWYDRSQQQLAIGGTATPFDFNVYAATPDLMLHDESDTSEVVMQLDDGLVTFWGRPTSAGNPSHTRMMTMDTLAPTGSLAIASSGHLSAVQGASIGTEINTGQTIFSIGNSGSSRAQMEFIDAGGSGYIEWGQSDSAMQFEGPSSLTTVEFNLGAPEYSLMLSSTGKLGMGTNAPEADIHVKHSNGTAKILVEETSGAAAPRTLFQLKNKGNTKFGVLNTEAGVEWAFANPGTGFRLSRQGSGVVEMEILNNGNMVIAGALTQNSDVNAKTAIADIDPEEILGLVSELPVSQWEYKDARGETHIGPMAQDFYAAFGLGASETGISTIDTAGVALVAIQALVERNKSLESDVENLKQMVKQLMHAQENTRVLTSVN